MPVVPSPMGNENFFWVLMLLALDSRFCMKKLGFTPVAAAKDSS